MATFITWKSYYSVNDPELDAEHRQIIDCINRLYVSLDDPSQGLVTKQVLDTLVKYTHEHFDHEEKRMQEAGFTGFAAHKELHDDMRRRTQGLRTHLTLVTARDVLGFLKTWWVDHIQGEDKLYASFLPSLVTK